MTKQTVEHFALSLAVLGIALIPALSVAQAGSTSKFPGKHAAASAAQAAARQAQTPGAPTYTFTLLNYPGQLNTLAFGINEGATTSKVEIVGYYGSSGFLTRVTGTKTVTETYETVNDPHGTQSWAFDNNDLGQIVGGYTDSSGGIHGYEKSGGKFTELNATFAGAYDTDAFGINNSGEIVGIYNATDGEYYGFTLIGGTYTSINYPGATFSEADAVNDNGDIVGTYTDASGVTHGFLLSGGTYISFDFPGATWTGVGGINDSGDIVGSYCTTSECISTYEGMQGYVLSGGTFTTIAVPNEFMTQTVDINNAGVIVGFYEDAAGVVEGFMATP